MKKNQYFSDQLKLWRLDGWNKVGSTLSNKANLWQSTDDWYFKNYFDDGSMIYIGNASNNKFLGTTPDGNVIEEEFVDGNQGQLWKKGRLNAEGYFTLENSEKSKFLTAKSGGIIPEIIADSLKITGNFETS